MPWNKKSKIEAWNCTSDLDQFKEFAKSKEAEIGVLKAQIAELKEKSEKKRKPKKEPMANEVAVNQNNNEVSTDSVQGDDFGDIVI